MSDVVIVVIYLVSVRTIVSSINYGHTIKHGDFHKYVLTFHVDNVRIVHSLTET